jgi:hypothetical protein
MNNTEKKLDALIDALGFDVEETKTFDSDEVIKWSDRWDLLEKLGVSFVPPDRPTPAVKYKFTKRDAPVNHEWTVDTNTCHAFDDDPVDDELKLDLWLTEAFKNVPYTAPYTARTTIVSSTILKRELLKILETAGKKPKKETIAIIEHAIDKAFKS